MPALTDEQLIAALGENGHEDVAEALTMKIDEAQADAAKPTKPAKAASTGVSLGDALRRAAGAS